MMPGRAWTALAAVLTLTASFGARGAAGGWELRMDDAEAGIRVYSRRNEKNYMEFRAVTTVRSTLGALVGLFRDVGNMPAWSYRTKSVRTLEMPDETEAYIHAVNEMPWPLSDRDSIVRTTLSQNPVTLAVTIRGSAVPGHIPPDDRYVRIPVVESFWRFTPLTGGRVEVEFQGYGDPGGSLASGFLNWVVSQMLWEVPYETLRGLRRMVVLPRYQSQTFRFVREAEERVGDGQGR